MRLCFGPYRAPVLEIGERATCAIRGEVIVRDYTDAPIPWPRGSPEHSGNYGIIITGDLLRALNCEMQQVIAAAWGVSKQSVSAWRNALGINGHRTAALRENLRARAVAPPPYTLTPEQQAKAVAALREARRARGELWTKEQEALLGTDTDRAIGAKLNRSLLSVRSRRLILGIPPVRDKSLHLEHLTKMRTEHFGSRYAVRWELVLAGCRKANMNLDQLAQSLGTTRSTLARRFPCGLHLWPADWVEKASRYFGVADLLVHPLYAKPFDYQRACMRAKNG